MKSENQNKNNIDEAIVEALQFSNMVLLEQSLQLINWARLQTLGTSIVSEMNYKEGDKIKTKGKKFEKVLTPKKKRKQKNMNGQSQLQKKPQSVGLQDSIQSKIQKNLHVIHQKGQNFFQNMQLQTVQPFKYQSSLSLMQGSSIQNSYSVNDFLKQTSICLSRNNQSPITAWNGNKMGSLEKRDGKEDSPRKERSDDNLFIGGGSVNTMNTSNKKAKSKFEKAKVTISKPTNNAFINNSPIPSSSPAKPFTVISSTPYSQPKFQQQSSDFDASTRATCELAPSKLQKLIEVEDNKYKEIVLKTYFKHQK